MGNLAKQYHFMVMFCFNYKDSLRLKLQGIAKLFSVAHN